MLNTKWSVSRGSWVGRFSSHFLVFFAVGTWVGWQAWGCGTGLFSILWVSVLPLMWWHSSTRLSAFVLMLGYYLAAARGLPGGTAVFFGDGGGFYGVGWVMWASVCFLLALPFAVVWTNSVGWYSGLRFAAAVSVSCVPPFAFIGWVTPLALSGVFFPGFGFLGLFFCLVLFVTLAFGYWRFVVGLFLIGLFANVWHFGDVPAPVGWLGVDTSFSRLSSGGSDDAGQVLAGMQRVAWVSDFVKSVPDSSVRVLPETILGSFDGLTKFSLRDSEAALAARGSRVLVGVEMPRPDGRYVNGLMILGAQKGDNSLLVQNIPVPYAMWKPWASGSAVSDVFGTDNVGSVGGLQVASLICYEQLLPFSVLGVMLSDPDVVVAVSNVWWVTGESIPFIQRQMVGSFARLFGVPVIFAKNS